MKRSRDREIDAVGPNARHNVTMHETHHDDHVWREFYRASGFFSIGAGVLTISGLLVIFVLGPRPTGGEAVLRWVSGQGQPRGLLYGIAYAILEVANTFYIPVGVGLYLVLGKTEKTKILIATGLFEISLIVYYLTGAADLSFLSLSDKYFAVSTGSERASYVAAADLSLALAAASALMAELLFSVSTLVMGLVMSRSSLGRFTGFFGVIASIPGIVGSSYYVIAIPTLGAVVVVYIVLIAIWFILVGYKLSCRARPG